MHRCKVVYYLEKEKESATLLIYPGTDVEIEFPHGKRKHVPFQFADFKLKGDSATTLEISWTDKEGRNFIYCNDEQMFSHLAALPGSPSFLSKVSTLSTQRQKNDKVEKRRVPVLLGAIAGILILSYLFIISLVPIATRMLPLEWEQKIGAIAYENFLTGERKITSPDVVAALSKIVNRIDEHDGAHINYELSIIDTKQVNAFALPGGYLIVTSELIKRSQKAEEVAGVLAHELTHVLERHGIEKLLRQAGLSILIAVIFGDTSSITQLAELASGLEGLSFNRDQEKKADDGAVKIMVSAGISPSNLISFFEKLKELEGPSSGNIPELISTHPPTVKRIERLSTAPEPDSIQPFDIDWDSVKKRL
ncbi:MAG: M48 family metallopeptidase [Deltaproteobacteria bacterium]|nr:M48 family metallopeptidase [Deltaproteobacteria bacterium]